MIGNAPIEVHPAHLLGIRGTAVRKRYGSEALKRGLDRLAADVALDPHRSPVPSPAEIEHSILASDRLHQLMTDYD